MIAEPTLLSRSVQKENSVVDVSSCSAANHTSGVRNENRQKNVRGKRKARGGCENAQRKTAKARAESEQARDGDVEAVTLFEVVAMGRSAMQAVVDDWIEAYITDREPALLDLISFFIQCSGCKGVVTAEMFQSKEDSDVMSKMVEDLDQSSGLQYKKFLAFPWILTVTWPMDMDSGEYPLVMSGLYWKRFRVNFCEFVQVLVSQCQYSVIFDNYLLNTLISLLTELSASCVRAFRHTCTLAAVKLLSALVNVALSLSVGVDNSQRLYEVEKAKSSSKRASLRLEKIQRKITELQDRKLETEDMMDVIFKGVFLKRYRDVIPEIRAICMEELTEWMKLYSPVFLNDTYLKYVGWMMYDKQPDVRLKCVLGLQGLYRDVQLSSKMDLFTSRFKERIVSMTLDKDHEVAVQAMRLLVVISQSCDDALSQADHDHMMQFVYSSYRPLAAAGEFLYAKLLSNPAVPQLQEEGTEEERSRLLTLGRLRALSCFYTHSQLHQHVLYLVDSLWDCGGALLKDWASLTSLLTHQTSAQDQALSSDEEAVVVEVLVASVRQAAEGPPLVGRSSGKKVIGTKEKRPQTNDCAELTDHFLKVLPELISKYLGDAKKLTSFLKIPQYFHMDACGDEHSGSVQALLSGLEVAVCRHSEAELLEAAARSYQSLCADDSPWRPLAVAAIEQLVQRWSVTLEASLRQALSDGAFTADEATREEILSTLKKLTAFNNTQDLSKWGICELASELLQAETLHGGLSPEMTTEALRCACCSVLWCLNTFGEGATSRELALRQRSQLRAFCEKCHRCLSHPELPVREQAFLCLSDVLVAHSHRLQMWEGSAGMPLLYTPEPRLQKALLTFVLECVFTGPEADSSGAESECGIPRLEGLHRRRKLLAAYCKLIVHSVLEMSAAAEIFKQYVKYHNDFGDIIKETLNRTRQMDKIESARTLLLCLQQLYLRLRREQDSRTPCSSDVQTFSSIKELARRLSLTFGWDQIKSRESLAVIHRDGIEFVFQGFVQQSEKHSPPYISYLTILSEFSNKLLKPDKKTIYSYLQRYTGEQAISCREECWMPLIYYRASLHATAEGEDAVSFISSDTNKQPSLTNRSRSPSVRQASAEDAQLPPPCAGARGSKQAQSQEYPEGPVDKGPRRGDQAESGETPAVPPWSTADEEDSDTVEIDV